MWDNWLISNSNVMKCPSGAFSFYIYILAAVQIFDQVTGAQMFGKHNLKLSNFNFITKSASLSNAIMDLSQAWFTYRVSQKTHFQNAAGATVHWLNHHLPAPLVSGDWFFGRFLLRLSRIKRPQVMSMVKFSPIALNLGYDFVLLVHFFGTLCIFSFQVGSLHYTSAYCAAA